MPRGFDESLAFVAVEPLLHAQTTQTHHENVHPQIHHDGNPRHRRPGSRLLSGIVLHPGQQPHQRRNMQQMPHRLIQGAHHRRSRNRRFQGRHRGPSFRHLIQRQISNDEELASAKSPLLLWGSSLWSEGEKGRKIDGLKYLKEDFAGKTSPATASIRAAAGARRSRSSCWSSSRRVRWQRGGLRINHF